MNGGNQPGQLTAARWTAQKTIEKIGHFFLRELLGLMKRMGAREPSILLDEGEQRTEPEWIGRTSEQIPIELINEKRLAIQQPPIDAHRRFADRRKAGVVSADCVVVELHRDDET